MTMTKTEMRRLTAIAEAFPKPLDKLVAARKMIAENRHETIVVEGQSAVDRYRDGAMYFRIGVDDLLSAAEDRLRFAEEEIVRLRRLLEAKT